MADSSSPHPHSPTSASASPERARPLLSPTQPTTASAHSIFPDTAANLDGPVSLEEAHLLGELVNSNLHAQDGIAEEDDDDEPLAGDPSFNEELKRRPWYKRPSPWWVLSMVPIMAMAVGSVLAPRVQLYTALVCSELKPELDSNFTSMAYPSGMWLLAKIPEPSKACSKDIEVQTEVAKLIAAINTVTGILSCLTSAFWSQLSDRRGRKMFLGAAIFGILCCDFLYILIAYAHRALPGSYRFLLFAGFVEGAFGGSMTSIAINQAYIADCSHSHHRARYFSLGLGLLFGGVGIGPTIGSLIIRGTGDLLSAFYFSTSVHFINAAVIVFLIPESTSPVRMAEAQRVRKEYLMNRPPIWKRLFAFLSPLTLLRPVKSTKTVRGRNVVKKDYNLMLIGAAMGLLILIMACQPFKFQYAASTFGWDSEKLGYWLTLIGTVRAIHLILVLPVIIKLFKPKPPPIALPASDINFAVLMRESDHTYRATSFDLLVARISAIFDLVAYFFMVFTKDPVLWTGLSLVNALGGGFGPAMQSIALELYQSRGGLETGKLFSAFSLVKTICSGVFGPTMFGLVYTSTVGFFPQAIFAVCSASVTMALICSLFVEISSLKKQETKDDGININVERELLVHSDEP